MSEQKGVDQQIRLLIKSDRDMVLLGVKLAQACVKPAHIHLLGDLGTGKTTLVRGFVWGCNISGTVKSPTYTLMETYLTPAYTIYHLDLYRLGDPEELEFLGLREVFDEGLFLIEWPQQGEGVLPNPDVIIQLKYKGSDREVCIWAKSLIGQAIMGRLGLI